MSGSSLLLNTTKSVTSCNEDKPSKARIQNGKEEGVCRKEYLEICQGPSSNSQSGKNKDDMDLGPREEHRCGNESSSSKVNDKSLLSSKASESEALRSSEMVQVKEGKEGSSSDRLIDSNNESLSLINPENYEDNSSQSNCNSEKETINYEHKGHASGGGNDSKVSKKSSVQKKVLQDEESSCTVLSTECITKDIEAKECTTLNNELCNVEKQTACTTLNSNSVDNTSLNTGPYQSASLNTLPEKSSLQDTEHKECTLLNFKSKESASSDTELKKSSPLSTEPSNIDLESTALNTEQEKSSSSDIEPENSTALNKVPDDSAQLNTEPENSTALNTESENSTALNMEPEKSSSLNTESEKSTQLGTEPKRSIPLDTESKKDFSLNTEPNESSVLNTESEKSSLDDTESKESAPLGSEPKDSTSMQTEAVNRTQMDPESKCCTPLDQSVNFEQTDDRTQDNISSVLQEKSNNSTEIEANFDSTQQQHNAARFEGLKFKTVSIPLIRINEKKIKVSDIDKRPEISSHADVRRCFVSLVKIDDDCVPCKSHVQSIHYKDNNGPHRQASRNTLSNTRMFNKNIRSRNMKRKTNSSLNAQWKEESGSIFSDLKQKNVPFTNRNKTRQQPTANSMSSRLRLRRKPLNHRSRRDTRYRLRFGNAELKSEIQEHENVSVKSCHVSVTRTEENDDEGDRTNNQVFMKRKMENCPHLQDIKPSFIALTRIDDKINCGRYQGFHDGHLQSNNNTRNLSAFGQENRGSRKRRVNDDGLSKPQTNQINEPWVKLQKFDHLMNNQLPTGRQLKGRGDDVKQELRNFNMKDCFIPLTKINVEAKQEYRVSRNLQNKRSSRLKSESSSHRVASRNYWDDKQNVNTKGTPQKSGFVSSERITENPEKTRQNELKANGIALKSCYVSLAKIVEDAEPGPKTKCNTTVAKSYSNKRKQNSLIRTANRTQDNDESSKDKSISQISNNLEFNVKDSFVSLQRIDCLEGNDNLISNHYHVKKINGQYSIVLDESEGEDSDSNPAAVGGIAMETEMSDTNDNGTAEKNRESNNTPTLELYDKLMTNQRKDMTISLWEEYLNKKCHISQVIFDRIMQWNADLVCPICHKTMASFWDWKKHFDHVNDCSKIFVDKQKLLLCCPPCQETFFDFTAWCEHMFESNPHGYMGSVAFQKQISKSLHQPEPAPAQNDASNTNNVPENIQQKNGDTSNNQTQSVLEENRNITSKTTAVSKQSDAPSEKSLGTTVDNQHSKQSCLNFGEQLYDKDDSSEDESFQNIVSSAVQVLAESCENSVIEITSNATPITTPVNSVMEPSQVLPASSNDSPNSSNDEDSLPTIDVPSETRVRSPCVNFKVGFECKLCKDTIFTYLLEMEAVKHIFYFHTDKT